MTLSLLVLANLGLTMALFGTALAIAWARFGRQTHVALWSAAFFAAALGNLGYVASVAYPPAALAGEVFAANASLICASLFSHGFRRRARLESWHGLVGVTVAMIVVVTAVTLRWPNGNRTDLLVHVCDVGLFLLSARTLGAGPCERGSASRAAIWMLAGFSAYIAGLALLAPFTRPQGPLPEAVYGFAFLVGVPAGMVGLGLFAMLLVASDLSDGLQRLASTDPLTGVLNRRGVDHAAGRMFALARRSGRSLTVVVADLDRFKDINDRFGHALGDLVLRRFAARCEAVSRDGDLVGRIGGEEFVMVLADASAAVAVSVMERLRASLPAALADLGIPTVTASFGIATLSERDQDLATLLMRADAALYGSKSGGRDRVTLAPTDGFATDPRFLAAFSRLVDDRREAEATAPPAYGRRS
jgi:diguanylate cyclase (GGDEF)-like protein